MALVASDNDSEFGYDFSAEEEELLHQLASSKSGSSHLQSTVNKPNHARVAIDSVPEKAHSVYGDNVSDFGSIKVPGSESTATAWPAASTESILPSLAPAASFDQDVNYPDCMFLTC